jgi:hypothetical protein
MARVCILQTVDSQQPDGRFVALVLRDLGAEGVRFLPAHMPVSSAKNAIGAKLPDGRSVVVTFSEEPSDREALTRRLSMLAQSFAELFVSEREARPPSIRPARSLQEELRALGVRSMAKDALVIDAHSPVVWASASEISSIAQKELDLPNHNVSSPFLSRGKSAHNWNDESGPLEQDSDDEQSKSANDSGEETTNIDANLDLSARAIEAVRKVVDAFNLKQGKSFQHAVQEENFGFVAHGFSSIYLLVLVYDAHFDELRAHRSIAEGMARIEKLVLALPPLDPDPTAGASVIAIRRKRR